MLTPEPLDHDADSLVLPHHIHHWLRAVVTLGLLSFVASVTLWLLLIYRLIQWQIRSKRTNQFAILIFNLVWADIQQSLSFVLNVEWLRISTVDVHSPICWAQGWFISTGDLASGVWCFTIGLHTFASVILDYRLKPRYFYSTIVVLWLFIYGCSVVGALLYGKNLYVRAGVWCWIHHNLNDLRLWTHYFWIFLFEFGTVIVYSIIYAVLISRIRSGYYTAVEKERVKAISNLMVVYPIVYVICTLPLASARMASMSGHPPSLGRLCLAGAMITSNGWLDVLLYTLTRRIMVFSDEPPPDDNGIDTFSAFWAESGRRFGGATTIEATGSSCETAKARKFRAGRGMTKLPNGNESSDDLYGSRDIKLVTTTHVTSEPAQPEDYLEMEIEARKMRPRTPVGRWSEDSANMKDLHLERIPD